MPCRAVPVQGCTVPCRSVPAFCVPENPYRAVACRKIIRARKLRAGSGLGRGLGLTLGLMVLAIKYACVALSGPRVCRTS